MNWLEEVREVLRGLNVEAVEMSEMVMVRFALSKSSLDGVYLRLTSTRNTAVEFSGRGMLTRATRSTIELIEDNLAAKGWVAV